MAFPEIIKDCTGYTIQTGPTSFAYASTDNLTSKGFVPWFVQEMFTRFLSVVARRVGMSIEAAKIKLDETGTIN